MKLSLGLIGLDFSRFFLGEEVKKTPPPIRKNNLKPDEAYRKPHFNHFPSVREIDALGNPMDKMQRKIAHGKRAFRP